MVDLNVQHKLNSPSSTFVCDDVLKLTLDSSISNQLIFKFELADEDFKTILNRRGYLEDVDMDVFHRIIIIIL